MTARHVFLSIARKQEYLHERERNLDQTTVQD